VRTARRAFFLGLSAGLFPIILGAAYWMYLSIFVGASSTPLSDIFSPQFGISTKGNVQQPKELHKLDQEENKKLNLLVSNLEAENAKLKEDLAFFEGFIPGNTDSPISLKRLQVSPDSIPNQYRYRALLIQGDQSHTLQLKVQLLIKVLNKDKPAVIVLPSTDKTKDAQFQIQLTRVSQVAGVFSVPEGCKLQSVELRILDGGTIRTSSTTKL
jgi:hypothetical protein